MTNYFKEYAAKLAAGNYLPIPIKPGSKGCQLKDWPHYRFKAGDEDKYGACGVGLLCGQGGYPLAAVDCDTKDPDMLAWLASEMAPLVALSRVGNAPKVLYVLRADAPGFSKMTSHKFVDGNGGEHQLEILGAGQQFVAFAIHPMTKRPYEWTDVFGGPTELTAPELPVVSLDALKVLIAAFNKKGLEKGWQIKSRSRDGAGKAPEDDDAFSRLVAREQKPDVSIEDAKKYLDLLPKACYDDRDLWIETGMALHFHFDASDEAYELWDTWSRKSEKYQSADETRYLWDGFGKSGHSPITIATVIKRANAAKEKALRDAKKAELDLELEKIEACRDKYEVQDVLKRASLSDSMDREELVKRAQVKIQKLSGVKPSLASIRGYLPRARNVRKYEMTEDGNAERMIDTFAGVIIYVLETGQWYIWNGVVWVPATEAEICALGRQTVLAIADDARKCEDDEQRSDLYAWCAASQKANMYKHMVEIARGDQRICIHASELDAQTRYVAVKNGEIDLLRLEFIPADPKHYLTQCMGVSFDATADCPLWKKTVLEVFSGNEGVAGFYQRICGYPLLGEPIEQKFFTLRGGGANGKSTLTNTVLKVFGSYGLITPSETLLGTSTNSNAGQTREDLLRLKGKRLVTVMEPDDDKPLKEGTIKALTGGEMIAARGLYAKQTVMFKPCFTLHFCTNHDLLIRGTDHGILRRTVIVNFERVFKEEEQDRNLSKKLEAEGSGILNWILKGIRSYRKLGLATPDEVKQATEQYKEGQDLTKEWLEECFEFGPGFAVLTPQAFQSWRNYAEPRGLLNYIKNTRTLGKRLSEKGFRPFRDSYGFRGRGFVGLRLKTFENLDEGDEK